MNHLIQLVKNTPDSWPDFANQLIPLVRLLKIREAHQVNDEGVFAQLNFLTSMGMDEAELRSMLFPKMKDELEAARGCHAGRDGECNWASCPQLRDNEPFKTGRHCPLDVDSNDEEYWGC